VLSALHVAPSGWWLPGQAEGVTATL